jgi:hypothetical protein
MKPYIAILIDSFWEAVGNKVLWALLIGWTLVLLGLAPFGYISERSFLLSSADIDNRGQLIEKLSKGAKGQGSNAIQSIASKLDPDFLERLARATSDEDSQGQRRINSSELAKELNAAITAGGLYSVEAFPTANRRKRLLPLIEASENASINEADVEELNRELLQLAFPLELNRPQGEQLWIGYAGFKIGEPLPISRRQIKQFLEPILLGAIIKLGLGILAVFVAIVVTSPIIPDTFRSGSLHLLLSKPISRVWLYLSKFFGGCIFVLVNITFVLIGLYFIAGLRFDIWNNGLLACVPLLMFVFVIFYSVSALAGLLWGNSIVCVVACMVFWLFCFSIGFMHDAMLPQVEVLPQITRIRKIEDHIMAVNEKGELTVWNDEFAVWQPALEAEVRGQARTFGPIYDASSRLVVSKSFFRTPFGGLQARSRKLSLIRLGGERQNAEEQGASHSEQDSATSDEEPSVALDEVRTGDVPTSASEARDTPVWMSDPGPELPAQLFEILELGDGILAVCRGGLYQLDFERLDLVEASQQGLFGIKLPWLSQNAFVNIAPKDYFLSENSHAAVKPAGDGLIVFSSGNLDSLSFDGSQLRLEHNVKLDGDGTEAALVQMNDSYCVVARDGLPLKILDAELNPLSELELPADQKSRQLAWIPGTNDLAIVTHTGNLLRLNCQTSSVSEIDFAFSGSCTCMRWQDADTVWLGVKPNHVYLLNMKTGLIEQRYAPRSTTLEKIYRWGVNPVYILNPKPAALDNAMGYVLSGNQTQALNLVTNDLEAAQLELDIWSPIFSNLAFVAVMLGISCIYVSRKEF